MVLEKTLESPLDCKEIQPVHPKEDQSWVFIGRTDAEAESPKLWPPDVKNWLIWKDPDAGKNWRQEKGTTEGEMVGWHYRLNGHEFEQTLGRTGKPCMLQSTGSQRVGHNWATAAKSLQLCPTLCDPIDGSPPGSPVHGILQARTLEWVAISFSKLSNWTTTKTTSMELPNSASPQVGTSGFELLKLCLKTAWVGFSVIWDRNSDVPTRHTLFTCPVKSSSDQW